MSAFVLDAGALVKVDQGDRTVMAQLRVGQRWGFGLRTTGAIVAQVWRDPKGRQVTLGKVLRATEILPVDDALGRRAGILLGRSGTADAVDATLVCAAEPGDRILTSDPKDISKLVAASGRALVVVDL